MCSIISNRPDENTARKSTSAASGSFGGAQESTLEILDATDETRGTDRLRRSATAQLDGFDDQEDGADSQIETEREHADPEPRGPLDRLE